MAVRAKVAQYFVNKKLQELESQDPRIKVDKIAIRHALPLFGYESETPEHDAPQQPPQQPLLPIIPTTGEDGDVYSWMILLKRLFEVVQETQVTQETQATKLYGNQRAQDMLIEKIEFSDESKCMPTEFSDVEDMPAEQISFYDKKLELPPFYRVAIIGAGAAGLRTAKLLQELGIPYKIFEASERAGGRIFTYEFAKNAPTDPQEKHDYYDVGAMRFPDNAANKRTFDLFKELGVSNRLIDYTFSNEKENFRFYNSECRVCVKCG